MAGGGTNNLQKHVEKEHMRLLEEIKQRTESPRSTLASDFFGDGTNSQPIATRLRSTAVETGVPSSPSDQHPQECSKQREFNTKLAVLISKNHLPLSTVDSPWFRSLIKTADPRLGVPSRRTLVDRILPDVSERVLEKFVSNVVKEAESGCLALDLWMSAGASDIFGLMFSTVTEKFEMREFCIGLLHTENTTGEALAVDLQLKLQEYDLMDKLLCIIKDGGSNLSTCTSNLLSIASNKVLSFTIVTPCLAHLMSLACSNAMKVDDMIAKAKKSMMKMITYTKKVISCLLAVMLLLLRQEKGINS